MIVSFFHYGFIMRGLEAGMVVALVAPLIGIFLVLRRYSLIADTLSHVSLSGIALGMLLGINPVLAAIVFTVIASLGIERLRMSKKVYGESALALFLSGSLAFAIVLLSLARGMNANLFNYLFGSIVTVTTTDVFTITILGALVAALVFLFYKELVYITFDEESALVAGIPVKSINVVFIVLTALTVALSIPIVGVLLIAALIVIPVLTALQLRTSFVRTIFYAELCSVCAVLLGMIISFYANLATGGTIVLLMLGLFSAVLLVMKQRRQIGSQ
ncbi:MAG: metal ABC transporter permease [Patescibacteria group bacterium]|nr:metal ABC transporter permease [Patescibacteria group bacterium]MDE2438340.1 metal ABC transporter permease [Patescibacteria group bacterium]